MHGLRDDLEREWERLAGSPGGTAALERWAAADERLGQFSLLNELIAFVGRPPSPRAGNDVLAALLSAAATDSLARRCLLQALLPCLVRLSGRYPSAGEDADERLQAVLVLGVERIHQLAGQDVTWPAVAIGGHVRDRLRRAARARWNAEQVNFDAAMTVPAGPERSAAEQLAGLVVDGLRCGTIRRDEAALLYTTRVAGHSPAAVAAVLGVDPVVIRARRRRAEQRLAGHALSVC